MVHSRLAVLLFLIGFTSLSQAASLLPLDIIRSDNLQLTAKTASVISAVDIAELKKALQAYLDELGVISPLNTGGIRNRRDADEVHQKYHMTGYFRVHEMEDL